MAGRSSNQGHADKGKEGPVDHLVAQQGRDRSRQEATTAFQNLCAMTSRDCTTPQLLLLMLRQMLSHVGGHLRHGSYAACRWKSVA